MYSNSNTHHNSVEFWVTLSWIIEGAVKKQTKIKLKKLDNNTIVTSLVCLMWRCRLRLCGKGFLSTLPRLRLLVCATERKTHRSHPCSACTSHFSYTKEKQMTLWLGQRESPFCCRILMDGRRALWFSSLSMSCTIFKAKGKQYSWNLDILPWIIRTSADQ